MDTTTEQETSLAARQISEKASAELQTLRERLPILQQRLQDLDAEALQIEQARENAASELAEVRRQDTLAAQAHKEALEYAQFAMGLAGEREATHKAIALEDNARQAHTRLEEIAARIEREESQRAARLEALRLEHAQARDELTGTHARIDEVTRIEQRALSELGEAVYARLKTEYQDVHQAQLEQAREQLAAAKIAETRFLDQALQELASWPLLQEQLRPDQALYHDGCTATLEAEIAYIDALMSNGQMLGNGVGRLRCMRDRFTQWRDLFLMGVGELAGIGTIRDDFTALQRRRRYATEALTEYRHEKGKGR